MHDKKYDKRLPVTPSPLPRIGSPASSCYSKKKNPPTYSAARASFFFPAHDEDENPYSGSRTPPPDPGTSASAAAAHCAAEPTRTDYHVVAEATNRSEEQATYPSEEQYHSAQPTYPVEDLTYPTAGPSNYYSTDPAPTSAGAAIATADPTSPSAAPLFPLEEAIYPPPAEPSSHVAQPSLPSAARPALPATGEHSHPSAQRPVAVEPDPNHHTHLLVAGQQQQQQLSESRRRGGGGGGGAEEEMTSAYEMHELNLNHAAINAWVRDKRDSSCRAWTVKIILGLCIGFLAAAVVGLSIMLSSHCPASDTTTPPGLAAMATSTVTQTLSLEVVTTMTMTMTTALSFSTASSTFTVTETQAAMGQSTTTFTETQTQTITQLGAVSGGQVPTITEISTSYSTSVSTYISTTTVSASLASTVTITLAGPLETTVSVTSTITAGCTSTPSSTSPAPTAPQAGKCPLFSLPLPTHPLQTSRVPKSFLVPVD